MEGLDYITVRNTAYRSWSYFVLYCYVLFVTSFAGELKEYCFPSHFNVTCPKDHVILIEKAMYGRMRVGGCIKTGDSLGCSENVLPQVQQKCSGRKHCFIRIPDSELHNIAGCADDKLTYLAAAYTCQKVVSPNQAECRGHKPVPITDYPGYISNQFTQTPSLPRSTFRSCLYKLTVPIGQKINITLHEFSLSSKRTHEEKVCNVYATILGTNRRFPGYNICGGNRHKVYTSDGNIVTLELMIAPKKEDAPYFLIKYEAVGCADPAVPRGAWFKRTGNGGKVQCNNTGQTWHIVCRGNEWVGLLENCTDETTGDDLKYRQESNTFPFSIIVAVLIGVCIGVIMGIGLLCFVSCVLKQQRSARNRRYAYRDSNVPEHTMMLQSKLYPCDHSYECTTSGPVTSSNLPPPLPPNTQQQQPKIPQYVSANMNECNMNCPCNTWNKCPEHHLIHTTTTTNQKTGYNDSCKLPSIIKDSEESLQQQQHFWDGGNVCPSGEDCTISHEVDNKGTDCHGQTQVLRLKHNENNEDLISHWPCQGGQIDTIVR